MIKSIIWDLDGVITNTSNLHKQAWIKTIMKFAGEEDPGFVNNHYQQFFSGVPRVVGIKRFLSSITFKPSKSESIDAIATKIASEKNKIFRDLVENKDIEVFEDSLNLLKLTKKLNIRNGLASQSENADFVIDKTNIRSYLSGVATGLTAARNNIAPKPDPAFYQHAASLLGTSLSDVMVIEDTYAGALSAVSAGTALCVGIARDQAQTMELISAGCDVVTRDLNQIIKILTLGIKN